MAVYDTCECKRPGYNRQDPKRCRHCGKLVTNFMDDSDWKNVFDELQDRIVCPYCGKLVDVHFKTSVLYHEKNGRECPGAYHSVDELQQVPTVATTQVIEIYQ